MNEYVTVSVGWWKHPKVVGLSLPMRGLWVSALCYAWDTDGFVPEAALRTFGGGAAQYAAALVAAQLWEPVEGGWHIHDFDEHQAVLQRIRRVSRDRQRKHRSKIRDQERDVTVTLRDSHVTSRVPARDTEREPERERGYITPQTPLRSGEPQHIASLLPDALQGFGNG